MNRGLSSSAMSPRALCGEALQDQRIGRDRAPSVLPVPAYPVTWRAAVYGAPRHTARRLTRRAGSLCHTARPFERCPRHTARWLARRSLPQCARAGTACLARLRAGSHGAPRHTARQLALRASPRCGRACMALLDTPRARSLRARTPATLVCSRRSRSDHPHLRRRPCSHDSSAWTEITLLRRASSRRDSRSSRARRDIAPPLPQHSGFHSAPFLARHRLTRRNPSLTPVSVPTRSTRSCPRRSRARAR